MKRLKQSEQVIVPANPATIPLVYVIIADHTAQNPPFAISELARYQQVPHTVVQHESRLRNLIDQEKRLLRCAFEEFWAATRHLIGTLVSWVIWRIFLPLSVMSVLWMAFASSAELPV